MTIFKKILKKVLNAEFSYAQSRTTIWRHKVWNVKKRSLYFWIWVSFNIDWNREKLKENYNEILKKVTDSLDKDDLDFLINWIEKHFYKVSKHVKIKDVNSKWKLFMHLLYILPYIKKNVEEKNIKNIEGFISKVLYNCTRSWYSNYCKKKFNFSLKENYWKDF